MAQDILVEEGLEYNNLISRLDESHKGAQGTFVRASSDSDFGFGVDGATHDGTISIGDGLFQARTSLEISWVLYTQGSVLWAASIDCSRRDPELVLPP